MLVKVVTAFKVVSNCVKLLEEIAVAIWIPGLCRMHGNKRGDKVAKSAASSTHLLPIGPTPASVNFIKGLIDQESGNRFLDMSLRNSWQ